MKIKVSLLLAASLLAFTCSAQLYIEPVTGYQLDMNHSGFKQINSAIQFSFKQSSHYEFILLVQKSWPLSFISYDSSFTANPSLPLYTPAQKMIQPGSFAVSVGHRFVVAGSRSPNKFSLLLNTGITAQQIKVSYQYDKNNYAVINPDKTQRRTSVFISAGAEYMRMMKNGRLFFQMNVCSPPAGRQIKYPSSFTFMAPLNLNAGYSIPIKKSVK
jgi:hypothetical protein